MTVTEVSLWVCIGVPFLAALGLAARPGTPERVASGWALGGATASGLAAAIAMRQWFLHGLQPFVTAPHVVFTHGAYHFAFQLLLDGRAATFLAVVQLTTGLVMRFSHFYMHREPGLVRFFSTVLLFQGGMCLLTLAANLDLMFAGWELVGVSSFLLIAFYRERQSAVRNALKTYSVYRIADIGMLLAACIEGSAGHTVMGLCLLLAAVGKSAQFPFSFWVVRAMEGPTPSSALFYGGLSVHAGAYLLLRTFDVWNASNAARICIGSVGLLTALTCSMFSRVQPTIKGQVGYASVTQVGLIFVEIALGLSRLALLHLVCNAFLRCYQLLVSPSVVAHRLRLQTTAGAARSRQEVSLITRLVPAHWMPTLYAFAVSEGYFRDLLKAGVWFPLRRLGEALHKQKGYLLALGAAGAVLAGAGASSAPALLDRVLAPALLAFALGFSACGLVSWRRPAEAAWWIFGSSGLGIAALHAALFGKSPFEVLFYGAGMWLSAALSVLGTKGALEGRSSDRRFLGLASKRPFPAFVAFAGAVGFAGLPLLPTFWGEDLMVHAARGAGRALPVALAALVALNGYLAVRNFALTFFGRFDAEPAARSPAQAQPAAAVASTR